MSAVPIYAWTFKSSSGSGYYETLKWLSGALTCDCPGWTRRTQPDGSRTCKHVRSVTVDPETPTAVSRGPVGTMDPYTDLAFNELKKLLSKPKQEQQPQTAEEPEPFGRKFNL